MRIRNKKTGQVVDVPSHLEGNMMKCLQDGGDPMSVIQGQENSDEQMQQIIVQYAQSIGADPNEVMKQLQSMSPEEQQQAIQQMYSALLQGQQGGDEQEQVHNNQEEEQEIPMQQDGGKVKKEEELTINHPTIDGALTINKDAFKRQAEYSKLHEIPLSHSYSKDKAGHYYMSFNNSNNYGAQTSFDTYKLGTRWNDTKYGFSAESFNNYLGTSDSPLYDENFYGYFGPILKGGNRPITKTSYDLAMKRIAALPRNNPDTESKPESNIVSASRNFGTSWKSTSGVSPDASNGGYYYTVTYKDGTTKLLTEQEYKDSLPKVKSDVTKFEGGGATNNLFKNMDVSKLTSSLKPFNLNKFTSQEQLPMLYNLADYSQHPGILGDLAAGTLGLNAVGSAIDKVSSLKSKLTNADKLNKFFKPGEPAQDLPDPKEGGGMGDIAKKAVPFILSHPEMLAMVVKYGGDLNMLQTGRPTSPSQQISFKEWYAQNAVRVQGMSSEQAQALYNQEMGIKPNVFNVPNQQNPELTGSTTAAPGQNLSIDKPKTGNPLSLDAFATSPIIPAMNAISARHTAKIQDRQAKELERVYGNTNSIDPNMDNNNLGDYLTNSGVLKPNKYNYTFDSGYAKKGGDVSKYTVGEERDMTPQELAQFIRNGGEVEFL